MTAHGGERGQALLDALWARVDSWRADCCADVPPCSYHQGCIDGIDSLGITHVSNLGIHQHEQHISGVPFGRHVKPGDGYCGDFPLDTDDLPVFRLTLMDETFPAVLFGSTYQHPEVEA